MVKRPLDQNQSCIEVLSDQRTDLEWLAQLRESVESIADFGCRASPEAFALLWRLCATEIVVIEKEKKHLARPVALRKEFERSTRSHCLEGRTMEFIAADMLAPPLRSNHFDLAYCEEVLYFIADDSGLQRIQDAINEMARVIKPGGWVIAIEPKMGMKDEEDLWDPLYECKDISEYFRAAGLTKSDLDGAPDCSYCYRRLQS
jgi:SAM-dependent methyltransferase